MAAPPDPCSDCRASWAEVEPGLFAIRHTCASPDPYEFRFVEPLRERQPTAATVIVPAAERIDGLEPVGRGRDGGTLYLHAHPDGRPGYCTVEADSYGRLSLECECHLSPVELAIGYGIALDRLHRYSLAASADYLSRIALKADPTDRNARALSALVEGWGSPRGPRYARRKRAPT